jgi:hypothetical protein
MKWKAMVFALLVACLVLSACGGEATPPLTTGSPQPAPTATTTAPTSEPPPATPQVPLTPEAGLQAYLEENFTKLETIFGYTTFAFKVVSNTSADLPYDYWIQVEYDWAFFYNVQYANNQNMVGTQATQAVGQLRGYMDKLARAAMAKMPGKKLFGGYYYAWYPDPADKTKMSVGRYFSWANYVPAALTGSYADAKIADLTWDSSADGSLLR